MPPALALGELAVHPEQLAGEERRFVATRPGANFEDDVLLVVRVLRYQQDFQLGDERVAPRIQRFQFLPREVAHVRVARRGELLRARDVAHHDLVLAEALHERLEFGERLGVLPVLGRVALDLGRAEQAHQLFVPLFFRQKLVKHIYWRAGPHAARYPKDLALEPL